MIKYICCTVILIIIMAPAAVAGQIHIDAEEIEYDVQKGVAVARHDVIMAYNDMEITCDYLEASTDQEIIRARGNVTFKRQDQVLTGDELVYNTATGRGTVDNVAMEVEAISFSAATLTLEGNVFVMDSPRLTTCAQEVPHYYLTASSITLREGENLIARSVQLVFRGVPIFYFPYLNVPLDDRARVLTLLQLGHTSNKGYYLSVPLSFSLGTLDLEYGTRSGLAGTFTAPVGKSHIIAGADATRIQAQLVTGYRGVNINASMFWEEQEYYPSIHLSHSTNGYTLEGGIQSLPTRIYSPYISLYRNPYSIHLQRIVSPHEIYWRGEARVKKTHDLAFNRGQIKINTGINGGIYSSGEIFASIRPYLDFTYQLSSGIKIHAGYRGQFPLDDKASHSYLVGISVDISPGNTLKIENLDNATRYEFLHETDCYNMEFKWDPSREEFSMQAQIFGL